MFYLLLQHVQTRYILTIHHIHTMILVSLLLITSSTMLYSALQASAFLGLPSPIANNNNFLIYQDSALGINPMESAIIGSDSGHHDAGASAGGTHDQSATSDGGSNTSDGSGPDNSGLDSGGFDGFDGGGGFDSF